MDQLLALNDWNHHREARQRPVIFSSSRSGITLTEPRLSKVRASMKLTEPSRPLPTINTSRRPSGCLRRRRQDRRRRRPDCHRHHPSPSPLIAIVRAVAVTVSSVVSIAVTPGHRVVYRGLGGLGLVTAALRQAEQYRDAQQLKSKFSKHKSLQRRIADSPANSAKAQRG